MEEKDIAIEKELQQAIVGNESKASDNVIRFGSKQEIAEELRQEQQKLYAEQKHTIYLGWKKDRVSLVLGVVCFGVFLWTQTALLSSPGNEIQYLSIQLIALLGVLQNYLWVLARIVQDPFKRKNKWLEFGAVLITGHFGSWIYGLLVLRKMSRS